MSCVDVGLPAGQMGNSEVGHMILGAGRIVHQDLTLIHKDIDDGTFYKNPVFLDALRKTKGKSNRLHLMGLLGDGGVHSHQRHMEAIIEMARREQIGKVYLHLFLDGRDTPPNSAEQFVLDLDEKLKAYPNTKIATVTGRYYAMDRDKRWDRVEKAYLCLTEGNGNKATSALAAIRASYKAKITDEFVLPTVIEPEGLIRDGDGVVFFNFRADRARELTRALTDANFKEFYRKRRIDLATYVTMTQYDETFKVPVAYAPREIRRILGEVASEANVRQLRIAETEKYAHVTYFFNGGVEKEYPCEQRLLVPSPKIATYDLQPEMSAFKVTDKVLRGIDDGDTDVFVINFANPDMVGHTGKLDKTIEACQYVDNCLGWITKRIRQARGITLITADHGNAEQMIDPTTGSPHTAHTTNPVPFHLIDEESIGMQLRGGGALEDVAPTLLGLLGLEKPSEMTGRDLRYL